jgi:hypothetical protein
MSYPDNRQRIFGAAAYLDLHDVWYGQERFRRPTAAAAAAPVKLQYLTERFFYTGPFDMVPLAEAQGVDDVSGLGMLGVGVETEEEFEVWAYTDKRTANGNPRYVAREMARARQWRSAKSEFIRDRARVPVSIYPVIAIGVRVPT